MRKARRINAEAGLRQYKLLVVQSVVAQLDILKQRHKLKSRERTAFALLKRARQAMRAHEYPVPPLPPPEDHPVVLNVNLYDEHVRYLREIMRHLRGVSMGVAFEAVALAVTDLDTAAEQLSLLEEEAAVTG